jgi:DNA-binding LacI/PurR family transcriptional regulator
VDPTGEPAHDFPSVGASNWSGGLAATRHLIELGHRRIGMVAGPARMLSARARLDGYRAALDMAGIPVDPDLIREGEFHLEEGFAQARHLLELPEPPTAIFASNDAQAIGVYQAAHEAGVRIPHELSVVGFDDLPPAEWLIPALTTVRQPLTAMAAEAATMAIALARGETLPRNRLILSTELVVRASTVPPGR